ncbi:hypothetical protein [Streptomyces virginiae]|uniref:ATP-grasp domain-containing protein n=1 Tax=Streptomyces virginiae TaxID=1961 RepID=A0ABZ1TKT0_STRVG|nr:hypothetical protein [Streptomyces virginiae]WTB26117.1 hypothetical protein OG253_34150 [Streptomyces virginiae]
MSGPQPPRTLLLVADGSASDAIAPLLAQRAWLAANDVRLLVHAYAEVTGGGLPALPPDTAVVLGFPHAFWDSRVEGILSGPYGTADYAQALRTHLLDAEAALDEAVAGQPRYLNSPRAIARTRDKAEAQRTLRRAGVPVPSLLDDPRPDDVLRELASGTTLYVKAVCGSMGKGMAHLAPGRWQTNYHYDGYRLLAPPPPAGAEGDWERREQWLFQDVPVGDHRFLERLCLTPGFLFERGIGGPGDGSERTEFRITVAGGTVAAADERRAPAQALTTRRAEGGASRPSDPHHPAAGAAAEAALAAAEALHLGYAVFDVVTDADGAPYVVDTTAFPATGSAARLWRRLLDLLVVRPLADARPVL